MRVSNILFLAILLLATPIMAQQFEVTPDSTEGIGVPDDLNIFGSLIVNQWDQENHILWTLTSNTPEGWTVEICQGLLFCWAPWITQDTLVLPPNGRDTLFVKFHTNETEGVGWATMLMVAEADTNIREEITFVLTVGETGVGGDQAPRSNNRLSYDLQNHAGFSADGWQLNVPSLSNLSVAVYNVAGQRMETLLSGAMSAGVYNIPMPRQLANGVYFLMVTGDLGTASQRFVSIR